MPRARRQRHGRLHRRAPHAGDGPSRVVSAAALAAPEEHRAPAPLRDDPLDLTGDDEFTVCSFNLRGMGSGADQYPLPAEYAIQLRKRAAVIAEQLQGLSLIHI